MSYEYSKQFETASAAAFTSTGDKLTLTPAVPIRIKSFGYVITVAGSDGAGDGMVVKLDKRVTAGSDTGRGDGDLGTMTLTTAQVDALAAGDVARAVKQEASGSYAGPAPVEGSDIVLPGEQAVLEVTNAAGSAGSGVAFIEYEIIPRLRRASTVETIFTS